MRLKKYLYGQRPSVILASYVLGLAGSLIAMALGLPLPMMLGSLLAVGIASALGLKLFGEHPRVPEKWRMVLLPIVGTAIGGGVPEDFIAQLATWWPTVLAVFLYVPLAHFLGYQLYRRFGRTEPATAYFAAMPGGFIEAMEMGQERGADMAMLSILQFLRLILCILLVPILFSFIAGHAVGSSAGVEMPGSAAPLGVVDFAILAFCAIAGYFGGRAIGLPAAVLVGPMTLSGLAHAMGLTAAVPPGWTIQLTQFVVGTTLGMRFAGFALSRIWAAVKLSFVYITMTLTLALILGLVLAPAAGQPVSAVVLAFAAGGVTEMALVAISLNLSAVYVTLHHVVRIIVTVFLGRFGWELVRKSAD